MVAFVKEVNKNFSVTVITMVLVNRAVSMRTVLTVVVHVEISVDNSTSKQVVVSVTTTVSV